LSDISFLDKNLQDYYNILYDISYLEKIPPYIFSNLTTKEKLNFVDKNNLQKHPLIIQKKKIADHELNSIFSKLGHSDKYKLDENTPEGIKREILIKYEDNKKEQEKKLKINKINKITTKQYGELVAYDHSNIEKLENLQIKLNELSTDIESIKNKKKIADLYKKIHNFTPSQNDIDAQLYNLNSDSEYNDEDIQKIYEILEL